MVSRRDIDVWLSMRPTPARALGGFLPALAAASGIEEVRLRSWDAIRAAAETIKASRPRPAGPAKLIPIGQATTRDKRHPEALAIATQDDAIRLAHDYLEVKGRVHAQVEASFNSELVAMKSAPAGRRHLLRTRRRPAKFSKDPAENDRLVAEWTALRESVRPQLLAGDGRSFDAAISYPGADIALVLRSKTPIILGTVALPAGLTPASVPDAIAAGLASGQFTQFSLSRDGASAERRP